jgi:hypothetical protein
MAKDHRGERLYDPFLAGAPSIVYMRLTESRRLTYHSAPLKVDPKYLENDIKRLSFHMNYRKGR